MKRREFIGLLGGAAVASAWPRAARAQAMPVIGYLGPASADGRAPFVAALRAGLQEAGFVEGQNILIEPRFADNQPNRLPALAAELVRRPVTVLAAAGNAAARVAKDATATIPVVFVVADDPVKSGLVASLNRPGGNVTGATTLNTELGPKRLELMHELVPGPSAIALLVNPTNSNVALLSQEAQDAARALKRQVHVLRASADADFESAFVTVAKLQAGGLVIGADAYFNSKFEHIAALSVRHRVPTVAQNRDFVAAGGLASYGGNTGAFRTAGLLIARVLQGERPADLPVQQETTIELRINMKTAKALGVTVPLPLLGRADEVIE